MCINRFPVSSSSPLDLGASVPWCTLRPGHRVVAGRGLGTSRAGYELRWSAHVAYFGSVHLVATICFI